MRCAHRKRQERLLALVPPDAWIGQTAIRAAARMAPATCIDYLRELVADGYLAQARLLRPAKGRPAFIYRRLR